jgi:hypothetical protein
LAFSIGFSYCQAKLSYQVLKKGFGGRTQEISVDRFRVTKAVKNFSHGIEATDFCRSLTNPFLKVKANFVFSFPLLIVSFEVRFLLTELD